MITRRTFLKGIFAGAAAAAMPFPMSALQTVHPELFTLRGDGARDDSAALQALVDGKTVIGPDGTPMRGYMVGKSFTVHLPAGNYRIIDRTIALPVARITGETSSWRPRIAWGA